MLDVEKIPFGLANIIIGEDDDTLTFDGVEEMQAEGGEVTLTPMFEDIVIADYGNGVYDQRLVGFEGQVTIVAAQESIDVLEAALAATETITDTSGGEKKGIMDAPIGTSLRKKAKRVRIHPRQFPDSMKDLDITIYKMASNGEFTRSNANEQGNITITLNMFPRDGMDPSKPGNFFYFGGIDPNGEAPKE
ncbi:hypothetical protein [Lederbergia galactosidilytica]|uniref:Uncharacterized protein n=1 Tax=Lederbergia galactosidilytica TaxID=217031 RepID=A0A177ZQ44_9BACI|nr:hypothetical protein [Lederbergia galactosidilytica]OAK70096.1 hypothetical protein ABB05_13020 [Lederbergia galactosidilytica]